MESQKYKWGKICPFFFQTAKSSYVTPIVCKLGKGGLTKKDNGYSERKGDIIPKLRLIARSRTEADMNHKLKI